MHDPEAGETVDRFQLDELLARGGMAIAPGRRRRALGALLVIGAAAAGLILLVLMR